MNTELDSIVMSDTNGSSIDFGYYEGGDDCASGIYDCANVCDGTKAQLSLADFIPYNLVWEQGEKRILLRTGFNRCVKTTHQKKFPLILLCY